MGMEKKRACDSWTEQVHILMPADINGSGRLFGGMLMQWIDIVAAVVARRHSGRDVTTASVENLTFLAPAKKNDTVIVIGNINYVGKTSMEVCVDTFVEALSGERKRVNRAYVVMVAIGEDNEPVEVPGLVLEGEEQKAMWAEGEKRHQARKLRRRQGNLDGQ